MRNPVARGKDASAAVAVLVVAVLGLGNVWRLPDLIANHGGSAFLLTYLVFSVVLAWPLMAAELTLGKLGQGDLPHAVGSLVRELRLPRAWRSLMMTVPMAALLVLMVYGCVASWGIGYAVRAALGITHGESPEAALTAFVDLASDPERGLAWYTVFWVCVAVVSARGWRRGLVRAGRIGAPLMIALALYLLAEVWRALAGDFRIEGFFAWRPDQLGLDGVMAALSQACFSLTIGLGMVYSVGRHLNADANVLAIAGRVVVIDLTFTLIVGLTLYGASVAAGVPLGSGVRLVFVDWVVVGEILQRHVLTAFYALIVLITWGSALVLIEPLVAMVERRWKRSRESAATRVVLLSWALGLIVLLSFGPLRGWAPYGRPLLDWPVFLAADFLVPLNCVLIASFVGRALPANLVASGVGSKLTTTAAWYFDLRFLIRVPLVAMLLYTSGVVHWLVEFYSHPGVPL